MLNNSGARLFDELTTAMQLEDSPGGKPRAAALYAELARKGNTAAAHNLARMNLLAGDPVNAAALFRQVIKIDPHRDSKQQLAFCLTEMGQTKEALEIFREIEDWQNLCFYSLHTEGDHSEVHRQWGETYAHPPYRDPHSLDKRGPLRIGYLCPESTTVYPFLMPVLTNHSERVQPYLYSDQGNASPWRARLLATGYPLRDCFGKVDDEVAQLIAADDLDVLIDLRVARQGVMARHLAPLQCSWIGYPHWSGIAGVQLLEDLWAWEPDANAPEVSPAPAEVNGYVTFGHLNRACKITATMAEVWAAILGAVSHSKLVVLAAGGERNTELRSFLEANGIAGDRLKLIANMSHAKYLEAYSSVDISLDSFPYNGTTTTMDALWQGVPVVSLAGERYVSRVGSTLLNQAGLSQLVAHTPNEYLMIAVNLARDVQGLAAMRAGLRQMIARSSLVDGKATAAELEAKIVWLRTH